MAWKIWIAVFVVLIVIEAATMALTTIWFAGGALVAFLASLLGAGLLMQTILFIVVSVILLAVTRPLAVEFFNKGRIKTNAESLIGETAVVQQEIDNLRAKGMVINGQEWSARSVDNEIIPNETLVEIMEISGVKLLVRKK